MTLKFQTLVDNHYENLYRFALSLSRSSNDAWDLTQETFLIWARKGGSLRKASSVKSWLYTTLYREFLKVKRRSSRVEELDEDFADKLSDESDQSHVESLESKEIMEVLLGLSDNYRTTLSLYYLESYSYKEISAILEVPIGTVMSRLARGKDLLRKRLNSLKDASGASIIEFPTDERKPNYG